MKILIFAYASEPGTGSEYGVGWTVPTKMAEMYPEHEIYVLTRSRCREKIYAALNPNNDSKSICLGECVDSTAWPNLHFLFYDIPKWMFYKNEMKSNWGEQINYMLWQVMVRRFVRKIHKKIHFDVMHHLTFNQYRTPSPGFWMDVPFVMGPIGGAETIAESFAQDLNPHTARKEEIRRKGRDLKVFSWFMSRRNNKKVVLCSCAENMRRLQPYANGNEMRVLPAIAFSPQDFEMVSSHAGEYLEGQRDSFSLLYAGKAWDWKGLKIFLRAAKKAYLDSGIENFTIKIVGIRFKKEQDEVMSWIEECGLQDKVTLIPFIKRSELLKMMTEINLSVYPAFRDSGSMSILEASALGCPTICFNAGGQDVFPDEILLKVPIGKTYNDNLNGFAERLLWAYEHQIESRELGLRSKAWVKENLTWDKKVKEFVDIYKSLIPDISI